MSDEKPDTTPDQALAQKVPAKPKADELRRARKSSGLAHIRTTWISAAVVFAWIALAVSAAIALFAKGYLLSRPVFENASTCAVPPETPPGMPRTSADCWTEPSFDKAVLVVIDALRFDFVVPDAHVSADSKHFHNQLPFLHNQATQHPKNSLLLKFLADPPTTTLQRLKGLTTGSLPTFLDAGSNFAGTDIDEDNWVRQANRSGKTIAFVGDDTWVALFPKDFHPNMSYPYDSLNVHDLYTVDNGVFGHIFPFLEKPAEWDIAIAHLLGVDHAGHRYGPNHPAMAEKLQEMNLFIHNLTQSIDEKTLLIVMGDHGMDTKGDHGGDSVAELESTLWMYSKKPFFGRLPGADVYDVSSSGKNYRAVSQIDFVPTISLLLGLPVPFNNLGFPIAEAFLGPKSSDQKKLAIANGLTASQIHQYAQLSNGDLPGVWQTLAEAKSVEDVISTSTDYQEQVLEHYRDLWVKFDIPDIVRGIAVLVLAAMAIWSASNIASTSLPSVAKKVSISGTTFGGAAVALKLTPEWIYSAGAGVAFGVILALLVFVKRDTGSKQSNYWTIVALLFALVHALIFTSNSFTIWEQHILTYILGTFSVLAFGAATQLDDVTRRTIALWHCAAFLLLTKLASLSQLCREEHGSACQTTFYQNGSSVSSPFAIAGLGVIGLILPQIVSSFYSSSGSNHGSATVWLTIGVPVVMGLSAIYWVLDGAETYNWNIGGIDVETLQVVKVVISRIGLGATVAAANYGWYNGSLCVRLDLSKSTPSILGYYNVYGSYFFLFILNVFGAAVIVNKPLGGVVLAMLVYHVLTLLEIIHILELKDSIIGPIMFGILGSAYFFATGHQATIPSIQWDIGFVASRSISFPLTHFAILVNTLGPYIITSLASTLIPLWKVGPYKDASALVTRTFKASATHVLYHALITLSTMIWATYFRRHLMVWKIFAPRFMLAGVTLPIVIVTAVIGMVASGCTISEVAKVFG